MNRERFDELIRNYQEGRLSGKLLEAMDAWFDSLQGSQHETWTEADVERLRQELDQRLQPEAQGKRWLRRWLPYAAAVLLVASVVGYFAVVSQKSSVLPTGQAGDRLAATEILPGGNKATLTLADGRIIDLSEEQAGIVIGAEDITYDDGTALEAVILSGEGEVSRGGVEGSLPNSDGVSAMLSLSTPKGGTYQITLPDGSKVWLNSASTLKYPSRFTGDTREVILEGEAYFDIVSMDRARITDARERSGSGSRASSPAGSRASVMRAPFKVKTNGQTVEVLGTQFNISAYADDPETKTTLVEGKVKVTPGTEKGLTTHDSRLTTKVLSPGQQATLRARPDESGQALPGQGAEFEIHEVNTEQYASWKDGYFSLSGTIPDILKRISRWYDIEVVYEGRPEDRIEVAASIPRNIPLGDILLALQEYDAGLTYKLTETNGGRRLTISR